MPAETKGITTFITKEKELSMNKKYQIFISSTYTDLIEERKEITRVLLEMDCIPTGMEMFQASDDNQWEVIKRVISLCDYYLVIVAGRYGSVHPKTKKSYTQMEYEYAMSLGIPIIGFVYKDINDLPLSKIERVSKSQKKLERFRNQVEKRLVKYWSNLPELIQAVSTSVYQIMRTHPRDGWIKNAPTSIEFDVNSLIIDKLDELTNTIRDKDKLHAIRENVVTMQSTLNSGKEDVFNIANVYSENHKCKNKCVACDDEILYLKKIHIDCLKEIGNIILSGGMSELSRMFNISLPCNPPEFVIFEKLTHDFVEIKYAKTSQIIIQFEGAISGIIILSIQNSFFEHYYTHIINRISCEIIDADMKISAIKEVGSIFAGSTLVNLSEIFCYVPFVVGSIKMCTADIINHKIIKDYDIAISQKITMPNLPFFSPLEGSLLLRVNHIQNILDKVGFSDY